MANNFQNGPGGRLVKAQADATSVYQNPTPTLVAPVKRPSDAVMKKLLEEDGERKSIQIKPLEGLLEARKDATRVNFDPRPKGPYIIQYDKTDLLNPFDWKYEVVKGLKKANSLLGGDIERGGYEKESYGDLINRLEQTPSTLQNSIKNFSGIPNIPSPLAGPANLGINALNAVVGPKNNRGAAAVGEVVLDPINYMVGAAAKGLQLGMPAISQMANLGPRAAQALKTIGNSAPWVDRGNDVAEGVTEYNKYPTKPKFEKKEKEMTLQEREFLQKLSRYNFANVK